MLFRFIWRRTIRNPWLSIMIIALFAAEAAGLMGALSGVFSLQTAKQRETAQLQGSSSFDILALNPTGFSNETVQSICTVGGKSEEMVVYERQTFARDTISSSNAILITLTPIFQQEVGFRKMELRQGYFPDNQNQVAVDSSVASTLNLKVGSQFYVLGEQGEQRVTVSGITNSTPGGSELLSGGVYLFDNSNNKLLENLNASVVAIDTKGTTVGNLEEKESLVVGNLGSIENPSLSVEQRVTLLTFVLFLGIIALGLVCVLGAIGLAGFMPGLLVGKTDSFGNWASNAGGNRRNFSLAYGGTGVNRGFICNLSRADFR